MMNDLVIKEEIVRKNAVDLSRFKNPNLIKTAHLETIPKSELTLEKMSC